ncbi:TrkH family potassium uptake protein [Salipiger sp. P9]|uniref:TrkH family potassium uptake protein n=1 Tax=Salipiger pentaromativorans TaxID=2943193 RepID=UPI00215865FF|nr:potassium transporter TrkG [Salipiger pentaromativorans]MCR8549713.1 TrkH family potassium uptake protein [Salipiger pentaromativorans]
MRALTRMPLILLLTGLASASMILPAAVALAEEEFHDARSFFYSALVGMVVTALVAIAQATRPHNRSASRQLFALMAAFVLLPAVLAVPFHEAVRTTTFLNAFVEMISSLTTTGATLFAPDRLSSSEHLWRAQVGWMGGLLMWVAAAAILAPLTLGGFEVTARGEPGQSVDAGAARRDLSDPAQRLSASARLLVPIYAGLTLALWIMLLLAGDPPLVALSHAMSTMATSGISPIGGPMQAPSGLAGEMIVFCFLFFALSRLTFSGDTGGSHRPGLGQDPEFRMGIVIAAMVPAVLFLRHWIAAFEVGEEQNWLLGLRALWGGVFTALSFLSTTGFVSADWAEARGWSGLPTPGLILMGLAIVGGGVATTAGGVKLLRIYALYLAGKRELERLVHPSSVGRSGVMARRIRRQGAFIAWVFFMLFAMSIAAFSLIFGLFGIDFENAMVLTIAGLTNCGPLIFAAAEQPVDLAALTAGAKLTICAAMVLGRLELLAIIVLLTPDIWRD